MGFLVHSSVIEVDIGKLVLRVLVRIVRWFMPKHEPQSKWVDVGPLGKGRRTEWLAMYRIAVLERGKTNDETYRKARIVCLNS